MATVRIKAYPVDNWMSFIVWLVGSCTRRVHWNRAHWTIAFVVGGDEWEYDLSAVGVRLNPMEGKEPSFCHEMPVSTYQVRTAQARINEVTEALHHVCLESLLKAFLYPNEPRLDTCIGFVYYILWGRLDRTVNYPERWYRELYEREERWKEIPNG